MSEFVGFSDVAAKNNAQAHASIDVEAQAYNEEVVSLSDEEQALKALHDELESSSSDDQSAELSTYLTEDGRVDGLTVIEREWDRNDDFPTLEFKVEHGADRGLDKTFLVDIDPYEAFEKAIASIAENKGVDPESLEYKGMLGSFETYEKDISAIALQRVPVFEGGQIPINHTNIETLKKLSESGEVFNLSNDDVESIYSVIDTDAVIYDDVTGEVSKLEKGHVLVQTGPSLFEVMSPDQFAEENPNAELFSKQRDEGFDLNDLLGAGATATLFPNPASLLESEKAKEFARSIYDDPISDEELEIQLQDVGISNEEYEEAKRQLELEQEAERQAKMNAAPVSVMAALAAGLSNLTRKMSPAEIAAAKMFDIQSRVRDENVKSLGFLSDVESAADQYDTSARKYAAYLKDNDVTLNHATYDQLSKVLSTPEGKELHDNLAANKAAVEGMFMSPEFTKLAKKKKDQELSGIADQGLDKAVERTQDKMNDISERLGDIPIMDDGQIKKLKESVAAFIDKIASIFRRSDDEQSASPAAPRVP